MTSGAHILVVEDLDAFRHLLLRVLSAEGHQVVGVGDAPAAFELSSDDSFDLLISDYQVPGGNGTEIARHAVSANPSLKILFMSGSPESSLDLQVTGTRPEFLQKPFEIDVLLSRVQQLLGPRGPLSSRSDSPE